MCASLSFCSFFLGEGEGEGGEGGEEGGGEGDAAAGGAEEEEEEEEEVEKKPTKEFGLAEMKALEDALKDEKEEVILYRPAGKKAKR